jgi:hypothetical protein
MADRAAGDLPVNVAEHARFMRAAGVPLPMFPELSLAGYEPAAAPAGALAPCPSRVDPERGLCRSGTGMSRAAEPKEPV